MPGTWLRPFRCSVLSFIAAATRLLQLLVAAAVSFKFHVFIVVVIGV